MKVTFYSNFLNHHQIPFCNEMYKILGENFAFVATEPMDKERREMGWYADRVYPYEIRAYESEKLSRKALELAIDSDVIIHGSAPEIYVRERLKSGKRLTFRYSERIYKRGVWRVVSPRGIYQRYKTYFRYMNKPLYMLCASAYTAGDLALLGSYIGKCYKWGYFPEFVGHDLDKLLLKKASEPPKILWTGRYLGWKHPEHAIEVARRLRQEGYNFLLEFIGIGERGQYLRELVGKYKLDDTVKFLGPKKPEDVRKHMEEASIYLITSDFNEGWGVVLNEAMNSACAVVASHAAGSVPFLIKHGKNGFVYKYGNVDQLYQYTKLLLDNRKLREEVGREAYKTISNVWNPKVAAERILKVSESLLNGKKMFFEDGPCSKAKIILQHEMYNKLMKNAGK